MNPSTRTTRTLLLLALSLLLGSTTIPAHAQESFPRQPGVVEEFVDGVPSPEAHLGVAIGDRFTPHHDVLRYCQELARRSPRVRIQQYGRTPEGRELILLFISTPENLARLDTIRSTQQSLADPRTGFDLDQLSSHPGVVWLSYNVHGNEAACTEAALQVAYHLAASQHPEVATLRNSLVTIIDPLLNPDGRERYVHGYHSRAPLVANPDGNGREHREPWPGGRSNHYYFDLNRDWAWLSQPETRARIAQYIQWQPLVHVDFHEMSAESSYFFFPASAPINSNYPAHTLRWGERFGRGNAAMFDRWGWEYYTTETFDLFYPAYGDSWPSLHGAIGMTYEQAGSGRAGLRYRRRDGEEITLRERAHHHFVSSFSTLNTAATQKEFLQRSFHEFRKGAIDLGSEKSPREYVFPRDRSGRAEELARLLVAQGVEVMQTKGNRSVTGLEPFFGEAEESVFLPAGSFVVSLAQPAGRLARALLEPQAEITEKRFYDVSAWSLPFSMGVAAYQAKSTIDGALEPALTPLPRAARPAPAEYAYVIPWTGARSARWLARLQKLDVRVRLLMHPIRVGTTEVGRGGLVILTRGQEDKVETAIDALWSEDGFTALALGSGWTDEGYELASDSHPKIAPARIAVATGSGIQSGSFGAVWSLLEREIGQPFCAFDLDDLGSLDLDDYNVLILPHGRGIRGELSGGGRDRLDRWLRDGGHLIAIEGSAFGLEGEKGLTRYSSDRDDPSEATVRRTLEELRKRRELGNVPGNIFSVDMDPEHPLSFGMPRTIYAFMDSVRSFEVRGSGGDVGMFTEEPDVSGMISEENVAKIGGRVYLAQERRGRGRITLFAGDPNFRGFWRGLTPIFLNAVYLQNRY